MKNQGNSGGARLRTLKTKVINLLIPQLMKTKTDQQHVSMFTFLHYIWVFTLILISFHLRYLPFVWVCWLYV